MKKIILFTSLVALSNFLVSAFPNPNPNPSLQSTIESFWSRSDSARTRIETYSYSEILGGTWRVGLAGNGWRKGLLRAKNNGFKWLGIGDGYYYWLRFRDSGLECLRSRDDWQQWWGLVTGGKQSRWYDDSREQQDHDQKRSILNVNLLRKRDNAGTWNT